MGSRQVTINLSDDDYNRLQTLDTMLKNDNIEKTIVHAINSIYYSILNSKSRRSQSDYEIINHYYDIDPLKLMKKIKPRISRMDIVTIFEKPEEIDSVVFRVSGKDLDILNFNDFNDFFSGK